MRIALKMNSTQRRKLVRGERESNCPASFGPMTSFGVQTLPLTCCNKHTFDYHHPQVAEREKTLLKLLSLDLSQKSTCSVLKNKKHTVDLQAMYQICSRPSAGPRRSVEALLFIYVSVGQPCSLRQKTTPR